ncbi:MAG: hypothetical protein JSS83_01470 [Cyanobacteria bacterium SZAS LIN-3]|nr:hypothetical protein [Cyanobacteria bacterium SZAS LIN-3]
MPLKKLALNPYLHLALLAVIVAATFSRTLGTYFLADDFGEIAYVSRIAAGDLGMLAANFTGNYMQIPSMSVWRPWLLVSLLSDCLIWGANPFGYYLTNLLSYIAVTLNLYLLMRNLTSDWCRTRSALAGFFSALIFALSPLHCESVSWVVGRVDIVCAFFYLTCLNLFILAMKEDEKGSAKNPGKKQKLTVLSVMAFWLAMWTKEMAIGAPVLAFAIALLWGHPALAPKKAWLLSRPLIISTFVYFALRYMALGTLLGGYTQGIGDAQAAGALSHWLDPDTARRLFFPLAYSIYGENHALQTALALVFVTLLALTLIRLGSLQAPLRWLIFLPLWLATALAPIYKLWGLGYELEGARFVFFATMPLAAFFPVLLFAPHAGGASAKTASERRFRPAFAALSIFALLALSALYGKIAARLNLEWVHAGKEVREFAEQSRALAANLKTEAVLLGIPKRRGGAHMVLNGTTFKILLQPPFTREKVEDRFLTFDPIIFGNSDYINARRFQDSTASGGTAVYIWDSEKRKFNSYTPAQSSAQKGTASAVALMSQAPPYYLHAAGHATINQEGTQAAVEHSTAGDGIYFRNLNIIPGQADYAAVTLTCLKSGMPTGSERPVPLACSWNKQDQEQEKLGQSRVVRDFLPVPGKQQTVYLKLSSNYRWYTQESIPGLFLELPQLPSLAVSDLKILPAAAVAPQLQLHAGSQNLKASQIGVYSIKPDAQPTLAVKLPETGSGPAAGATEVELQISKPNAFFENFKEADQNQALQETRKVSVSSRDAAGRVEFKLPALGSGANYEVRARLLGADGRTAGDFSDPLVLRPE